MTVITRLYDTYDEARDAADAVNGLSLPGVEASVLGNESLRSHHEEYLIRSGDDSSGAATGAGIGATIGGGAGLLAGLGMLAIPGLGPVVAAGWLAATAVGVVGGAAAGGAVGALSDLGISDEDAPLYSEAVRRGGVLVSARFPETNRTEVEDALEQASPVSIDSRREEYLADGWRGDETEAERAERLGLNTFPPAI